MTNTDNNKAGSVYDYFAKTGYKGSRAEFDKRMQNPANREKAYKRLSSQGYEGLGSFEDFNRDMGYGDGGGRKENVLREMPVMQSPIQEADMLFMGGQPTSPNKGNAQRSGYNYTPTKLNKDYKGSHLPFASEQKEDGPSPLKEQVRPAWHTVMDNVAEADDNRKRTEQTWKAEEDFRNTILEENENEVSRLSKMLEVERSRFGEEQKAKRAQMSFGERVLDEVGRSPRGRAHDTNSEINALKMAARIRQRSAELAKNAKAEDSRNWAESAGAGFRDTALSPELWSMGIADGVEALTIKKTVDKFEKGEELSEGDQALLDAVSMRTLINQVYGGKLSGWHNAGQMTAHAIPFMMEMALNPLSGAGKSITKSVLKYGMKRFGTGLGNRLVKGAVKGVARSGANLAGAAGMSLTTSAPAVIADGLNRHLGEADYSVNQDGSVNYEGHVGGESLGVATGKAFLANTIEKYSEMLGGQFGHIPVSMWRKPLEKIGVKRVVQFLDDFKSSDVVKQVGQLAKATKWDGPISELPEEIAGGLLNSFTVGDQDIYNDEGTGVLNKENIISTAQGLLFMSGAMSVLSTGGYGIGKALSYRGLKKADKLGLEAFRKSGSGEQAWEAFKSAIDKADMETSKEVLEAYGRDGALTDREKAAVVLYGGAVSRHRGALMAKKKAEEEAKTDERLREYMNASQAGWYEDNAIAKKQSVLFFSLADKKLSEVFEDGGVSVKDVIQEYGAQSFSLLDEMGLAPEQMDAVRTYANAYANYNGIIGRYRDIIDEQTQQAEEQIRQNTHDVDGKMYKARLRGRERQEVFVTTGHLELDDNNRVITGKSDKTINVRNPNTGRVMMIPPNYIEEELIEVTDGAQAIEEATAGIAEVIGRQAEQDLEGSSFSIGDSFVSDGLTYEVSGANPDGRYQVDVTNASGEVSVALMTGDEIKKALAPALSSPPAQGQPLETQAQSEIVESQSEEPVVSQPQQAEVEPTVRMARPEKGKDAIAITPDTPKTRWDYSSISDAETYVDALNNEFPDELEAHVEILSDEINELSTQIEKIDKSKDTALVKRRKKEDLNVRMSVLTDAKAIVESRMGNISQGETEDAVAENATTDVNVTPPSTTQGGMVGGSASNQINTPEAKDSENKSEVKFSDWVDDKSSTSVEGSIEIEALNDPRIKNVKDGIVTLSKHEKGFLKSLSEDGLRVVTLVQGSIGKFFEQRSQDGSRTIFEVLEIGRNGAIRVMQTSHNPDGSIKYKGENGFLYRMWANMLDDGLVEVAYNPDAKSIEAQREEVDTNPTEAQKEAGNYKKGHIVVDGLKVTIENPKGSTRSGVDKDGKAWSNTMQNDYGYILGTKGKDGDHIDMFIGESGDGVFVVDQVNEDGSFDEHKVMYGFSSLEEAKSAYLSNYDEGWQGLGSITEVSKEDFKKWIRSSKRKIKPFSEYKLANGSPSVGNRQGNPINEDGSLKTDEVSSVDEITDEDFEHPTRNVMLPILPENVDRAIGADGKRVVIKKNIFEKNKKSHKDLSPTQSREILQSALYRPDLYGNNQKVSRPYNWIVINTKDADGKNRLVLLEVNPKKGNLEIIHWHYVRNKALETIKRQAEREGGHILILPSDVNPEEAGGLSSRTLNLSSDGKVKEKKAKGQDSESVRFRDGSSYTTEMQSIKEKTEANGTFMLAPNGEPSKLNERQWLQVRTKAFKKWFGDWEKAARIEKLRKSEPVVLQGNEHEGKYELNRDSAKAWIKDNLRGEYTIADTGETVAVGRKGVNKVTSHSMGNEAHLKSLVAVPQLLERSIFIAEEKAEKKGAQYPIYRYYVTGIQIGGEDYTAKLTVGVDENGRKYYDHSLTEIEKGKLLDQLNRQVALDKGFMSMGAEPDPSVALSPTKDTKLVSLLQNNASKVVDENGEPRIVYHGTNADFTEFRFDKIGLNGTSIGYGFYLATSENVAKGYSKVGNVMPLFLNSRKFIDIKAKALTTKELKDLIDNILYLEVKEYELDDYKDGFLSNYADTYSLSKSQVVTEAINMIKAAGDTAVDQISELANATGDKGLVNRAVIQSLGYDAIVQNDFQGDGVAFVALTPNQIKSATDNVGTFDSENDDIRFRDVYHGSPYSFDAFDHSKMGTGEGAQSYGWGTYVTEVEGIAREYAKVLSNRNFSKFNRGIYTVDIPDDDGTNYLHWESRLSVDETNDIYESLSSYIEGEDLDIDNLEMANGGTGESVYKALEKFFGSDKRASEFLSAYGFVGVSYPAQHQSGGRKDGARNYVIFKEGDAKIVSHEKFRDGQAEEAKMVEEIKSSALSLGRDLGVEVDVIDNVYDITHPDPKMQDRMRKAKGWYDAKTGRVVIIPQNNASVADANATIFHEIVGHKGLKALYGDKFTEMIDEVFNKASQEVRAGIVALANRNGWDFREATEEYIAQMAEKGFDTPAERTFLQTLKRAFLRMLDKLGIDVGYAITDNDIRYMLWRSYQLQKSKGDAFDLAKDISMRDKLGVSGMFSRGSYLPAVEFRGDGLTLGVDKIEALKWIGKPQSNSEDVTNANQSVISSTKVIEEFENPSIDGEIRFRDGDPFSLDEVDEKDTSENREGMARSMYEASVSRQVKGVIKRFARRFREGHQDSMISLKLAQEAISKETGKEIQEHEDAYTKENHVSSMNRAGMEDFHRKYTRPICYTVGEIARKLGKTIADVERYLIAKHGLERNRVFALRDAMAAFKKNDPEEYESTVKAYNSKVESLKKQLEDKAISKQEYESKVEKLNESHFPSYSYFRKKDYSGLTALTGSPVEFEKLALEFMEEMENGGNEDMREDLKKDFDTLWSQINGATKATLKKQLDSGNMSRAEYDHVRNMFEYYVPLRGFEEDTAEDVYSYVDSKSSTFAPTLKKAGGRTSLASSPIANIQQMADSAIMQGNRNVMKQHFLNLAINHKTDLLTVGEAWIVNRGTEDNPNWVVDIPDIPKDATAEEIKEILQKHAELMEQLKKEGRAKYHKGSPDIKYKHSKKQEAEHVVLVKRNGKTYAVYVNGNPRLAQAVNGRLNPDSKTKNLVMEFLYKAKRWLSAAFTSWNPAFGVANLFRDSLHAATTTYIRENAEYNKRYTANWWSTFFKMWGLVFRQQRGTLNMDDPLDKTFQEFIEFGGETGFSFLQTIDEYRDNAMREALNHQKRRWDTQAEGGLKDLGSRAVFHAVDSFDKFLDQIRYFNRVSENISRFATYRTSREVGRSIQRSVSDAKEVTVNFNRKGSGEFGGELFNGVYAFYNVGVQGLDNIASLAKKNPKKFTGAMSAWVATGMAIPFINQMLMSLLGDDDTLEAYYNLPDHIRRNNMVLWVGGDNFITMPLAIEFGGAYGIGTILADAMMGRIKKAPSHVAGMIVGEVLEMSPLPVNMSGDATDFLLSMSPTGIKPAAEAMANRNFYGGQIYKEPSFNKELIPNYQKAFKNTSKLLVEMSEEANELFGGNKYKKADVPLLGWIADFNPAIVEHIVRGYLGGAYTFAQNIADTSAAMASKEKDVDPRQVPIINRFYRPADERDANRSLNQKYHEYKDIADEFMFEYRGAVKEARRGNDEYKNKVRELSAEPTFMTAKVVGYYVKRIEKLSKLLKTAESEEVKANIEERIIGLKKEMNKQVESIEEK